jgi:GTP cyclohydrolase I
MARNRGGRSRKGEGPESRPPRLVRARGGKALAVAREAGDRLDLGGAARPGQTGKVPRLVRARGGKALVPASDGFVGSARAGGGAAAADPLEAHVAALLRGIGEDPEREGLLKTPGRVARAWRELTRGYQQDVQTILNEAFFTERYDEMVMVKDIELYSVCEHHLLPWFGKAHVAYLPDGKILGLSKIARLVDVFARRLQVQERLTTQVAETLMEALQPKGVGVVVEARHLCMTMRGVEKQHSTAITSAMLGLFRSNPATRAEFLNLIRPAPQAP